MEVRISIGSVNHKGHILDTYVPEYKSSDEWLPIIDGYILKESFDPVVICKCGGQGCVLCNNRGLRRGIPVDNIEIAEFFCNRKLNESRF